MKRLACLLLRFLHMIGLTNLSDDQIKRMTSHCRSSREPREPRFQCRKCLAIALAMLFAATASAQSVTLPDAITGIPGQWIVVAPVKVDGGAVKWRLDIGLQEVHLGQLLPEEYVAKLKGKVVTATKPGRYRVEAWNAKGDVASDIATAWVVIAGDVPPAPVPPIPVPPTPTPNPPAPIPLAGFRVLVIYDPATLTAGQQGIVYGKKVRDYLQAKCVIGADGKTKDFWILQAGVDVSAAPKWIGDTIQRHPGQRTFMVVGDGATGYDGPIPASADEALGVLSKIGGP